jgi:hypothetical protein
MSFGNSIGNAVFALCLSAALACARPASGIVVDKRGNIYFIDSSHAVLKVGTDGQVSVIEKVSDGHWLALDEAGHFSTSAPKYFRRITSPGVVPTLIHAGGGAPLVVADDGALYYGSGESNGDPMFPGGLTIARILPDGRQSPVSARLGELLRTWDDGITGLASGFDRSIYAATWTGIVKIGFDGATTVIKHPISVPECDPDPADHKADNRLPYLRGIAVLPDGTIYAAATSCHAVVKIDVRGDVTTVMKSQRPWSPTGLAGHAHDLYVLEYTNANGPATEGWRPRVRKIDRQGRVTTVVSIQ